MKKSNLWKGVAYGAAVSLLGVALGWGLAQSDALDRYLPDPGAFNGWMAVALLGAAFLALAVHELGHLLTGLLQGFRFELFVVGFLGVRRNAQGAVRPYLNRDPGLFGGVAASSPPPGAGHVAEKMARVLLAGPLTSLLYAALCWLIMSQVPPAPAFVAMVSGLVSLALFLATTLPERTGVFYTDRKRYQRLTGKGRERDVELALLQAFNAQLTGTPMRSLDPAMLGALTEDDSPLFQYLGHYFLYLYHTPDEESARVHGQAMQALESGLPKALTAPLQKELPAAWRQTEPS